MEFIGYIKEHESGLVKMGVSINDIEPAENWLLMEYYSEVLNYLEKAPILLGFLRWLYDENGESIGPLMIHTDGHWIWPSYLVYYLNRGYQSMIPDEFMHYMHNVKFMVMPLTDEKRKSVEIFYTNAYQSRRKRER
ncbi:hypothetical protein CLV59_109234 [Chitinophaga dinghuensis]|uniref:Uncharacterized protein n=1 Tax=Chitinophaga dinghuensis TaxID=1539050 RepID=A0A327VLJ0_9BACT|nr:hypothetical protein [Chitinophaga dinghuensis]RAJ75620.1 hypothetical protein CLV59_109234 [Chitinophaga dinghuensis]